MLPTRSLVCLNWLCTVEFVIIFIGGILIQGMQLKKPYFKLVESSVVCNGTNYMQNYDLDLKTSICIDTYSKALG